MPIDCYECRGLGDDYRFDEDGELVSNCDRCPNNDIQIEAWYGQAEEDDGKLVVAKNATTTEVNGDD